MTLITTRLKRWAKRAFLWAHEIGMAVGIIILPKHYYVPIPDLRDLRRTRPSWARRSSMRGVAVDLDAQIYSLQTIVQPFQSEYRENSAYKTATAGAFGPGFGYVEAQALHGFIRGKKPRRIIEVGSGVSTYCMAEALTRNAAEGATGTITCIEPYPSAWLRSAGIHLIEKKIENVELQVFDELQSGDLLFIDSTHTVRVGGDVLMIMLEILPRLNAGVYVHFHDVYLPFDFQRDADHSIFQWMETALLHAYLIDNRRVEIVFCLSHLHYDKPEALRGIFPDYSPEDGLNGLQPENGRIGHFPSSLYLSTCAASTLSDVSARVRTDQQGSRNGQLLIQSP